MIVTNYIIERVVRGESPKAVFQWMMEQEVTPEILQSFLLKDELNPVIWNGDKMRDSVRAKLMKVAAAFYKTLDIEAEPADITLTGSIANYNWSDFSDIDLHLRVPFEEIDENDKLVRNYVLAKKSLWNEQHKLDIGGIPIEVYVENVGDTHVASGLYSVLNDKWIVKPKKQTLQIDLDDVKTKTDGYMGFLTTMSDYMKAEAYDKVINVASQVKDQLKRMRQAGLEQGGEFSVENLAFKSLRRSGYVNLINELEEQAIELQSTKVEGVR